MADSDWLDLAEGLNLTPVHGAISCAVVEVGVFLEVCDEPFAEISEADGTKDGCRWHASHA